MGECDRLFEHTLRFVVLAPIAASLADEMQLVHSRGIVANFLEQLHRLGMELERAVVLITPPSDAGDSAQRRCELSPITLSASQLKALLQERIRPVDVVADEENDLPRARKSRSPQFDREGRIFERRALHPLKRIVVQGLAKPESRKCSSQTQHLPRPVVLEEPGQGRPQIRELLVESLDGCCAQCARPTRPVLIVELFCQLDGRTLDDGIALGARVNALARQMPDFRAAIANFLRP